MPYLWLAIHDASCAASCVVLVMHGHQYWGGFFAVLLATTSVSRAIVERKQ